MDLEKMMEELQVATIEQLLEVIKSGECTSNHLSVARQLLRDNGITVEPKTGDDLELLNEHLKDEDLRYIAREA